MRKNTITTNTPYGDHAFENSQKLTTFKSSAALIMGLILVAATPCSNATGLTAAENAAIQQSKEHTALMNLIPANITAAKVIQSGSWSSPATWSNGKVPSTNDNIYVPEGKSLLVDVFTDAKFGKIRVDGALKFATNKNVRLKLDTLVVTSTGSFDIGTENQRIPASNKIEIIIANNGPINRTWDTGNLSRGVILQGKTAIYGTEKSAFHALAVKPASGATQLTLASSPTGWAKGDLIVVTATKFRYKHQKDTRHVTYDELRRIQAISGNTVTLGAVENPETAAPLQYSHAPTIAQMPVYAANLSRNVVFSGEGETSVPASQRGHVMIMHDSRAVIKGAGFYYLGRTDKSKPIDDFKLSSSGNRIKGANGSLIADANNNPRGRYPLHFHHTGVADASASPAICSGNAVISSPGWGFVNHTSNVIIENNASYDVYGSHYVSEDGNELGAFKNNIAIKSEGRPTYLKKGQGNHDMGHTGHGFWLESRNMTMENNVVSGVNDIGVVYWHRNETLPRVNLMVSQPNLLTPDKEITKNMPSIWFEYVPNTHEKNTTVLSSGGGLIVIKAFHKQMHDVRNMIESFKAYSVLNGLELQYVEKYTLKDVEIIADPATAKWDKGVTFLPKVADVVAVNLKVKGFMHPIITGTTFAGVPDQTDIIFVNSQVNDRAITPAKDIHKPGKPVVINYNSSMHRVMNLAAARMSSLRTASQGNLSFSRNPTMSTNFPAGVNLGYVVSGVKTDSLGTAPYQSKWLWDQLGQVVKQGYYTDGSGNKYLILKDLIADRATGITNEVNTKLKIISNFKELGPNLGPLP